MIPVGTPAEACSAVVSRDQIAAANASVSATAS